MSKALKAMIVDDSVTYRHILASIIEKNNVMELSAKAINGRYALEKLKRTPVDIVFLDIEMPEMDGLTTLHHIKEEHPDTKVVIVSSQNRYSADVTVQALNAGAIEFITKPDYSNQSENEQYLTQKISDICTLISQKASNLKSKSCRLSSKKTGQFDLVTIGVSTGGPKALLKIFPELSANISVPIVIVQHMPEMFTHSLAKMLNDNCALNVKEAVDEEVLEKGNVYIAPGNYHLLLTQKDGHYVTKITQTERVNSCRPAYDVLLNSVKSLKQTRTLNIVMTGMGSDGLTGMRALEKEDYYCITQSESSSVVYGMARAIDEFSLSDESLDLDDIPKKVNQYVGN